MTARDIETTLPHRRPMLMVGRVLEGSDQHLIATTRIDKENPFIEDNRLPGHVGLEMIAQASGLFLGLARDGDARPGAIVAIRGMQISMPWLELSARITIETELLGGGEDAAMFHGRVLHNGHTAVVATLTLSAFPEGDTG
jgi:predicted hotdog family 3-hydroxylacyl-ACP dehydratase